MGLSSGCRGSSLRRWIGGDPRTVGGGNGGDIVPRWSALSTSNETADSRLAASGSTAPWTGSHPPTSPRGNKTGSTGCLAEYAAGARGVPPGAGPWVNGGSGRTLDLATPAAAHRRLCTAVCHGGPRRWLAIPQRRDTVTVRRPWPVPGVPGRRDRDRDARS